MSSFDEEANFTPSQNVCFDSGFGPSGSFGEGYLHDNYESGNECDLSLDIDDDSGPLSLQPASLQLHTTIFDNTSLHVSSDVQNNDSDIDNTGTHSSETGSTSTVTYTSTANTACIGVNVDLSTNNSDNIIDNFPSNPDHMHGRVVANIQDDNSGFDAEQRRDDSPPVLSHVRAEPIKVKEIIIRTPVVE